MSISRLVACAHGSRSGPKAMEAKRLAQIAAPRLAQTIPNWVSLCAGRRSSGILPIAVLKRFSPHRRSMRAAVPSLRKSEAC